MKETSLLAKDIMTREVAMVSPFATLREAMALMNKHKVKALVMEKRHEHDAYGILTYTTLLRCIVAEEGDIDLINVYDVAAKPALTVSRELEIKHVARLMVNQGIRRIVITLNNKIEGVITMDDIVGVILKSVEEE
ncbi:MAG: CBS domain-containing protein [Helicobacteraceae bacterium]|jgi:signal-transduction protein with cAMP-binding, CBS, and nucleotidyltransferase domain|nr:CBS domain-containing protein [Helicobacteraceae bacterium]